MALSEDVMARIVVKFGGTSVADPQRIENAAAKVAAEVARGNQVTVVVSAMAGVTNQLVEYCTSISPLHDAREYDAVVASGEQITSGLMALALQKKGVNSRSWTGWQVPIRCNEQHGRARITDIDPKNLSENMDAGEVPVVAGFQGISDKGRISTLGRGGSDTTAVALAAALKADRCDIYTDVNGVYTTDPRIVQQARKLNLVSYEEMLEMAALGAKVLHPRSVELAMAWHVPVQVLSSFDPEIGSDLPGTLVTKEEDIVEKQIVNGVAYARNEAKITVRNVPDVPGIAASVFGPLAESGVNVDMIIQNISPDGKTTDMTFTVPRSDLLRAKEVLGKLDILKGIEIKTANNVAKISVIGIGMSSNSGVAQMMFRTLADKGINIQVITTSEIKISVLIEEDYTELAVRALHAAYGLEGANV
jgi:aspartate kinase